MIAYTKSELKKAIADQVNFMKEVPHIENDLFLLALSGVETTFGTNNKPRFERAYSPEGKYGTSDQMKHLYPLYGTDACCSYGPWQILFVTAYSLGYRGLPIDLEFASTSLVWTIKFLNKWISEGADTLEKLADCWNSGTYRDLNIPYPYIDRLKLIYTGLLELRDPV